MMAQESRRVLVGVDGSPAAREALAFAVQEAALRDATLVPLMAVELPDFAWIDPYAVRSHPEEGYLARAEETLRSILEEVDTTGLAVEPVVTTTPAARALVDRSAHADLLVVGSRGRGGVRGMVMGSVSLRCVLHAHCPVTVVRPEPRHEEAAEVTALHTGTVDTRRETTATVS